MFSDVVSGSWLNRVGTGPAAASPSKKSPWRGQAARRTVGMLSLKINNNYETNLSRRHSDSMV